MAAAVQKRRSHFASQVLIPASESFSAGAGLWRARSTEETMVREIELLAVSLVFVFLGALVFGVIH